MDKAPAYEAGDCGFDPHLGRASGFARQTMPLLAIKDVTFWKVLFLADYAIMAHHESTDPPHPQRPLL